MKTFRSRQRLTHALFTLVIGFLACTALEQPTFSEEPAVAPLMLPEFPSPQLANLADRLYVILEKQSHYLLGLVKPWNGDPRYKLLTESRSAEHWIRPNTGAVQAFCFLYRFGPYDEKLVGMSRATLLGDIIVPMIRYLTETHVTGSRPTGDGRKWGDAWQSAHWAQMLGRGAWFIWNDLPEDLRSAVRRVVRHEAERIAHSQPPAQLRGDTKAEENAWNAQILSVAWLLMPHDPQADQWMSQFQRWTLSAFLRPADQNTTDEVDGRPVAEQFTGANIFDDFTLENHGFVHPDYMSTFTLSLGCVTDFRMTGRREPQSVLWNVRGIYENLKWFILPDMGFVYPSGQDWTIFRQPAWLSAHVLMFVYGRDGEAWDLATQTVGVIEKMQARSPEGAIYDPSEFFFPSTQTDIAEALARAWLHLHFADPAAIGTYQPRLGAKHLRFGKIFLYRTPRLITAISYGSVIMGTFTPNQRDRLISPDQQSLVGSIKLSGNTRPLPVKLLRAEFSEKKESFQGILHISHGDNVIAEWTINGDASGQVCIAEKLVVQRDCTIQEMATGLIGVLNNQRWIFEQGKREIRLGSVSKTIPAHSSVRWEAPQTDHVGIDHMMEIELFPPRDVLYVGATQPERGRATDRLILNHLSGPRDFHAGDVIAEWSATIRPTPRNAE